MSNRRVRLSGLRKATKVIADALGLAGDPFKTEVYQVLGISSNPASAEGRPREIHLEIHEDPDNHVSLPPAGCRLAEPGTTEIYEDTGGVPMVIKIDSRTRLVTITGASDLIMNGVSLVNHTHPAPGGVTGPPSAL